MKDKDITDSLVRLMVLTDEVEHYKTLLMPQYWTYTYNNKFFGRAYKRFTGDRT